MHWPAMDLEVAVTRIVAMVSERANLSVRHLMKHLLVAVANPSAKAMATACNSIEHVSVWLQACQRKTRRLGRSHRAHGYTRVHTGTHGYTRVHTGTHGYTRVHTGTHGYTRVHTDTVHTVPSSQEGKGSHSPLRY